LVTAAGRGGCAGLNRGGIPLGATRIEKIVGHSEGGAVIAERLSSFAHGAAAGAV
jgi:hypothetical protein